MTRGNQREKAREKNLKEGVGANHRVLSTVRKADAAVQKKKNTQSGTEYQKTKEAQAAIMRDKQAKAEAAKTGGEGGEGASAKKK